MACSIQFESHRDELAFIYRMEHDPIVLEFYDQPGRIKLTYQSKGNRRVGVWHTPDFFVLREENCGWIECKMEDDLLRLAEQQPHRYVHNADGSWSCPPGEAYAEPLGLFYQVRSSREIDWTALRNLRFLEEYVRGPRPDVPPEVITAIRIKVLSHPGITLLELLQTLRVGSADDVYLLIVTDQVYVDLTHALLPEPARMQVFLDRAGADTYLAMQLVTASQHPHPSARTIAVGTPLWYDGKPWTVLNLGETEVALLSEDKRVVHVPHEEFERLLQQGRLVGPPSSLDGERREAAHKQLEQASPKQLEVAWQRYQAMVQHPSADTHLPIPPRTLRRWRAQFREAEITHGNGYLGLLPDWGQCGDRSQRLPDEVENLIETFISEHYETLKQQPKREVYLLFKRDVEQQRFPVPSYTTFLKRIGRRPRPEQIRKRQGPRAAAQAEAWYWELERTTPRHGDRPWDVVHLDHTELDIELVSAHTGRPLGRPWATFMTDAFSRRLPVVYLTFDPPSYRSAMMALRECVWRYGRLPQSIIVDGGPDFRSTYFETLLAYYGCTKATRPWAKPHYGSVCERLFGTANTQFVHNLLGNTQIMKQVRQVTKAVQPREQAVWTLGDLYSYLTTWAYEVYDGELHLALGMTPREAFKMGLALGGERAHLRILYTEDFRFLSLPTTRKGTAKVEPGRGARINYLYYWSDAFRPPTVEYTQVPVRYDPFDIGIAYAFVQGRWVKCLSEHYLQLRGHSERELQLASAELRKRYQNHAGESAITAKRLAEFLASVESHEKVLMQRLHDLEARDVFARMGGYRMIQDEETSSEQASPAIPLSGVQEDTIGNIPVSEAQETDTDDEEFGALEMYGEYR
jgi:transposase InsO family protein